MAQQGQDSAIKQYAQNMVSSLQRHLDLAKVVAKGVGVEHTTISSILYRYPEAPGGTGTPGGQSKGTSIP